MSDLKGQSLCRWTCRLRTGWLACVLLVMAVSPAHGGSRWVLAYYRQIGNHNDGGCRTIENHLFREDGTKGAYIGVTNKYNPGWAVFGNTDASGWHRINPLDLGNCSYDIRLYNPGVATEQTPDFYFQNPTIPQYYSYITHWLYLSDDRVVQAHRTAPVYHYDLVDGINQVSGLDPGTCTATTFTEPPGAWSDESLLSTWSDYQAQTFIVPAGINRIVSAQAYVILGGGAHFTYLASIRQGSPTGPQIGPTAVSREVVSVEFKEVCVNWPLVGNAVPVTPGQTYALRIDIQGGGGCNAYATTDNNYAGGCLYNGATQVPGRDLLAVVVGVDYRPEPSVIDRQPAAFDIEAYKGRNPPSDAFTIANAGGRRLDYTITDNVSWLDVNPNSGDLWDETDTINVNYNTASLASGPYSGTITINGAGATNTPQYITVHLTIPKPGDADQDGDVDQEDFGRFQRCYTPSGVPQTDPTCGFALLDPDEDVDLTDYGKFQACLSGAGVPSDPACAD